MVIQLQGGGKAETIEMPFHSIGRPIGLRPDARDGQFPRDKMSPIGLGCLTHQPTKMVFHELPSNIHSLPSNVHSFPVSY